jgi:putative chitinase
MIDWPASQRLLGVTPDGVAGPKTYLAILTLVGKPCQPVADCLAKFAYSYGLFTAPRLAEFVAQIANETGGFTTWEENLHYSADRLCAIWPSHFDVAKALRCSGQPYQIAEAAYGGRMGNGPEGSGDGYKYRGRGALQLTGKDAYVRFSKILGIDLTAHPEIAADPYNSTLIALEFFKQLHVNSVVDAGDFVKARRLTNGGAIGLEHVAQLRARILSKLI